MKEELCSEGGRHRSSYSGGSAVNLKEEDRQNQRSMCVWERLNTIVILCVNECFMIYMLIELHHVLVRSVG